MVKIYSETDEGACRRLWEAMVPPEQLTDLWDVRACFHQTFKRPLFFVVAEEAGQVAGLLPMSFIAQHGYYGYFPGEVWHGKTWLEQNRLIARDEEIMRAMFAWLSENKITYHLRYLCPTPHISDDRIREDEVGYLFCPEPYHFSMDEYYATFSKKTLKKIRREVNRMYERDLVIRNDRAEDFEAMVAMNMGRFGADSYFASGEFSGGFRALRDYIQEKGWLKMTTVVVDGQAAAVDMGCVYNGNYKLLAGGTNADFPGVAKLINLYHMQDACDHQYREADFLCGDFSWKTLFHLTPRPLYEVSNIAVKAPSGSCAHGQEKEDAEKCSAI